MEEQLSTYSSGPVQAAGNDAPKRRRLIKGKTVLLCLCVLLALFVVLKIADLLLWPRYYDKYYKGMIRLCGIDESEADDSMSNWGYAPYEFSDGSRKCTLSYEKPSKGKYALRIQLDNSGFFTTEWNELKTSCMEPIDNDDSDNVFYQYEIGAFVGRFGKVEYYAYISPCYELGGRTYGVYGFDFTSNDSFDYHYGVSDEGKRIVESLRPEILKIKKELENEIIEKLRQ